MTENHTVNYDLYLKLRGQFPNLRIGDSEGLFTDDPNTAVYFEFDYIFENKKVATITISIADNKNLKLFYTKNILTSDNYRFKKHWFNFLRSLRSFAKTRLMIFTPKDIEKKNLDKRDYKQMSSENKNNAKDAKMNESSLYGSTKSSYQKFENARMIIRHTKKIQEESANSRTRHIQAIFVENANGERFQYPYNHLSGARAMMRHVANGGNPYDSFGQYIVNLSEQIYNLRKFNNIVSRNVFTENSEIMTIAEMAKKKAKDCKNKLEKMQRQSSYESIKENFTTFEKSTLDDSKIEALKNKFTLQQFNEELVDLFPYISDLIEDDVVTFDKLQTQLESDKSAEERETEESIKIDPFEDFRSVLEKAMQDREMSVILSTDEDEREEALQKLNDLMKQHFPVGTNALNAIQSLDGIIDDHELFDQFKKIKDADTCVRPMIMDWIKEKAPDLVDKIETGDLEMPDPKEKPPEKPEKAKESEKPITVAKKSDDSEKDDREQDGQEKPKQFSKKSQETGENINLNEIEQLVQSMYDKTTNTFPRGETGILIRVQKEHGDQAVRYASEFIENLKNSNDIHVERMKLLAGIR
jgi:hypothetical protein